MNLDACDNYICVCSVLKAALVRCVAKCHFKAYVIAEVEIVTNAWSIIYWISCAIYHVIHSLGYSLFLVDFSLHLPKLVVIVLVECR